MNFFEHQERARRDSVKLLVLFGAALAAIVFAIYAVVWLILAFQVPSVATANAFFIPDLFLWVSLGVVALVGAGSWHKTRQLRGGGPAVAERLGGRRVDPGTSNWRERRLHNVVEEMALASGVPVPAVYVMADESAINAFAAGYTPDDAAVAVTRGAMEKLSREELQGVIGHEFSHILHGDMRLNLRLLSVVFGIMLLSLLGQRLVSSLRFRSRGGRGKGGGGAIVIAGLALMVIGWIGVFAGNLIKAAISRRREFLADASSVQFTRNPYGLAGALKKIGGLSDGSTMTSPLRGEVSHMYFSAGVSRLLPVQALASHPPLDERIRRVDPGWEGEIAALPAAYLSPPEPEYAALAAASDAGVAVAEPAFAGASRQARPGASTGAGARPGGAGGDAGRFRGHVGGFGGDAGPSRRAADGSGDESGWSREDADGSLLDRIGSPGPEHLAWARDLLASIPEALRAAAHEPDGARALVYALLMNAEGAGSRHERETALARGETEALLIGRARELEPAVRALAPEARLPVLEAAASGLQGVPRPSLERFLRVADAMVAADGATEISEWLLIALLTRHLRAQEGEVRSGRPRYGSLVRVSAECALVLTALAREGHASDEEAARAFEAGTRSLGLSIAPVPGRIVPLALEDALTELGRLTPPLKRSVLEACAVAIATDGQVTAREAELFRAAAAWMDCPAPPLLAGQRLS